VIVMVQVTSIGNAEYFKKSFTMAFQMLLCGKCMKSFTLERRIVCTPLSVNCIYVCIYMVFIS
jgi:hypothetical protein